MKVRLATPAEAEECWNIRNQAIEAIFTSPDYLGKGFAGLILEVIKDEGRKRGFKQLTLSSTPNAQSFYEKHGFTLLRENLYSSALAQADLRCMDMSIEL